MEAGQLRLQGNSTRPFFHINLQFIKITQNLIYQLFSDGITNKLIGVRHNGDVLNTILVRIYGENTEKLIDRSTEIKSMKVQYEYRQHMTL